MSGNDEFDDLLPPLAAGRLSPDELRLMAEDLRATASGFAVAICWNLPHSTANIVTLFT